MISFHCNSESFSCLSSSEGQSEVFIASLSSTSRGKVQLTRLNILINSHGDSKNKGEEGFLSVLEFLLFCG